ncbi:MAG: histidinol-phosphate transaminase [Steroidobacterales bacterium]
MTGAPEASWLERLARPEIRALKAYEHAVWEPGLVRLHANELPWRIEGDPSVAGLNRYPEPHPHELTAALARHYGVPAQMLLAGRGSDEAIDLLVRAYCRAGQDSVVICPPTFGMYGVAARIQGAAVIEVPLLRDADYALDEAALLAHCTDTVKLVFLCSPNNPTGNLLAAPAILRVAAALTGRALVIVDEAYLEFSGVESLLAHIARLPGLVVLRTLSKAHGLAGARCGSLIADAHIVALLRKVIQPYAVTQLTIEAVFRMLEPPALAAAAARVATIRGERERLATALRGNTAVLKVWPSAANFLLVEWRDPAAALAHAHAAGMLVRDLRAQRGLEHAVRISVGTPDQNDRLLASLA